MASAPPTMSSDESRYFSPAKGMTVYGPRPANTGHTICDSRLETTKTVRGESRATPTRDAPSTENLSSRGGNSILISTSRFALHQ